MHWNVVKVLLVLTWLAVEVDVTRNGKAYLPILVPDREG